MKKFGKHLLSILTATALLCPALPPTNFTCAALETPFLNDNGTPNDRTDDFYEIRSISDLRLFEDLVNGTEISEPVHDANAKLMCNINMGVMPYRDWQGLGKDGYYSGTFDGNGHILYRLYQSGDEGGFVNVLDHGGIIKNLTLKDCNMECNKNAGGICCTMGCGSITNCTVEGFVISSKKLNAGGIVAYMYRGKEGTGIITNCISNCNVKTSGESAGGICGNCNAGRLLNCLALGTFQSTKYCGGIAGIVNSSSGASLYGNYWLALDDMEIEENIEDSKPSVGNAQHSTRVNEELMLSGSVCYALGNAFYQNIGQEYPTLQRHHQVEFVTQNVNTGMATVKNDPCDFHNGFCIYCDKYEEPTDKEYDGIYEISNAGQLYWFADYVNSGHPTASAILKENIIVNENVLDENGEKIITNFRAWQAIGDTNHFKGKLDGLGHTISGLILPGDRSGLLFNCIGVGGSVKNLGIVDSIALPINSFHSGGICKENLGSISNCYFIGSLGTNSAGICIDNNGVILNCYSYLLNLDSTANTISGICSHNKDLEEGSVATKIENTCYLNGEATNIPAVSQNYLEGTVSDCDGKSAEAFANGEVCTLLNARAGEEIWYQDIGTDIAPVLDATHGHVAVHPVGDVNGDSMITETDSVLILREFSSVVLLNGNSIFTDEQRTLADINHDGIIDPYDATLVLRYYTNYTILGNTNITWADLINE